MTVHCINNFNYEVSSITLLKQLKWMNIQTRFNYFTGIFMFKFVNNLLPLTFDYKFSFVKEIHKYVTHASSAEDITLPKCRTEFLKRTLCYSGPTLWNSLPINLRNSSSVQSFKTAFKSYLWNQS